MGEEEHRCEVPFSSHTMHMTYDCDVNLDHLVQVVFVRFVHSKASLFYLFHTVHLGRKLVTMCSPN